MSRRSRPLRQAFTRRIEELERVFEMIGRFAGEQGVGEQERLALDFVAEELFTNMVKYNDGHDDIEVAIDRDGSDVRLELLDRGVASFDLVEEAPRVDTSEPIENRTPGGLGIHLVKAMVDDLRYHYDAGVMRIIATKHLET